MNTIIEMDDIAEIERLKIIGRTVGYAPSDIASINNLYRKYLNPHASSCASCSNNLGTYTNELYNHLGNFKESSQKHFFEEWKKEAQVKVIVEVAQDKTPEQQVDDYVNATNTSSDSVNEAENQEVDKPKRGRRKK